MYLTLKKKVIEKGIVAFIDLMIIQVAGWFISGIVTFTYIYSPYVNNTIRFSDKLIQEFCECHIVYNAWELWTPVGSVSPVNLH